MTYSILATIAILESQGFIESLRAVGFKKADLKLITEDKVWQPNIRATVKNMIDQIAFGTLDAMGLQRIEIPAEYMSAIGYVFIQPCNWLQFAAMCEGLESTEDIINDTANMYNTELEARVIFAMIMTIANENKNEERQKVLQNLNQKLEIKAI